MNAGPDARALRSDYHGSLLDWLACASAGRGQAASRAAAALDDRLLTAAAAGHVLDFDDTWTPGLAHLSASTAPAALLAVAAREGTIGEALAAYARGFETIAVLARHAHPTIYERGLHPTAACGPVGAAAAWIVAERGGDPDRRLLESALALALARGAGLLASFGGDGKALGVAASTVAGRDAARLAIAGADAELEPTLAGLCSSWGVEPLDPAALLEPAGAAIGQNWIKTYPCCLQTHSAIEAALTVDAERTREGRLRVRVHPISLRAAAVERPRTGLEAKFSIPYLVAWALLRGRPTVASFDAVDRQVLAASERLLIEADERLGQSEAVIERDGYELARVTEALGSPSRPMSPAEVEAKVRSLAGPGLLGVLDDPASPVTRALEAAGL